MKALLSRLAHGDGVLDIGANVGTTAHQFAERVGPLGHVLAIEPDALAASECRRNVSTTPWVTVRTVAVDAEPGERPFYIGRQSVHSSLAQANVQTCDRTVTVTADTLDALAASVPRLKAIKIDAQGAEARILSGGAACLARTSLLWMVELWPDGLRACGSTVDALLQAFASRGWTLLAKGKSLAEPAESWDRLARTVATWHGPTHTNLLIGHGA